MSKFIVELRPNRIGSEDSDPAEAFLGRRVDENDRETNVPYREINRATEYATEGEARYDLKRLPDAFFDRYYPTIVDVSAPLAGPYEVHTHVENIVRGDGFGAKETVVGTSKRFSVIAPHTDNEKTVLVAEINDSVRNPWRFPVSAEATAKLLAAAPDLLDVAKEMLPLCATWTPLREKIQAAIDKATK